VSFDDFRQISLFAERVGKTNPKPAGQNMRYINI
jgi:hypothetical protein